MPVSFLVLRILLQLLLLPLFAHGYNAIIRRYFSFEYDGTQQSQQIFNVSELPFSLRVSDGTLLVSFCDQSQRAIAPVHRRVRHEIDATLHIHSSSIRLSLRMWSLGYSATHFIYTFSHGSECDGIIPSHRVHQRLLLSSVNFTEVTETAGSEDDSTEQIDFLQSTTDGKWSPSLTRDDSSEAVSSYEWYEFYCIEWWTEDDWYTLKYVTALILILVVILALCLAILTLVSCKHRKRTPVHTYSSKGSLTRKDKDTATYSAIELCTHSDSEKDAEDHNLRQAAEEAELHVPLNAPNDAEAVELELVVRSSDKPVVIALPQSASNMNASALGPGHQQHISQVSNRAVYTDHLSVSNELPSESESDSEELYDNDNNHDHMHAMHTPHNTTATLTMDPGCIPGSMHAANLTAYGPSTMRPSITSMNSEETAHTNQSDEGANEYVYDFDMWLKQTLQILFNDDWLIYFRRFKLHKVTDDVLVILCQNEADRSEMWKELFPAIGPLVLFKDAFRKELIRRQLAETYTPA